MEGYAQDIFELVLARPVLNGGGGGGDDAMQVHVWWRAPAQGARLVQVYVDGALYDVTGWVEQRVVYVLVDRRRAHRIELLGVDPLVADDVWRARPGLLKTWSPGVADVVGLEVLRDEALPVSARVGVTVDGDALGEYALWSSDVARGGFGALFGEGGFGSDAATGPGLGEGELGVGPLGADGFVWRWERDGLAGGEHEIGLSLRDLTGQAVVEPWAETVRVERLAEGAARVWVDDAGWLRWEEGGGETAH